MNEVINLTLGESLDERIFHFVKLGYLIGLIQFKNTFNQVMNHTNIIRLVARYVDYIKETIMIRYHEPNLEETWNIVENMVGHSLNSTMIIFEHLCQPDWYEIAQRPYLKYTISFKRIINQMIYVENGHFLQNIIGDPEFEWKHKRILYICGYKNKTIINDNINSICIFNNRFKKTYFILLDIRYDKKLKNHYEIATYLKCMKKLNVIYKNIFVKNLRL